MAKKKKTEDEQEESGGKNKKMIVIIGLVAAAAAYKFVLAPSPAPPTEEEIAAAEAADPEEGEIFPMEEIVVNLADTDESRYLRVGLALVLEQGTPAVSMETESAIAVDAAIELLSELTFDELRETGAKGEVRTDLSSAIRTAYDDAKVVRVLLTTFVMQ